MSLLILANGQTITATITGSGGTNTTFAQVAGSGITFPYTITADTTITFTNHDIYTISLIIDGQESYGKVVHQSASSGSMAISPSLTDRQLSAGLAPLTSATAVATASSGTIASTGISRVNPAGNITGVILAAGTYAGQMVTVINESAFTVTMATAATSKVADGTSSVIAAKTARQHVWDASTSLWYRLG